MITLPALFKLLPHISSFIPQAPRSGNSRAHARAAWLQTSSRTTPLIPDNAPGMHCSSHRLPPCSTNTSGTLLPQGLCTGCSRYPGCSFSSTGLMEQMTSEQTAETCCSGATPTGSPQACVSPAGSPERAVSIGSCPCHSGCRPCCSGHCASVGPVGICGRKRWGPVKEDSEADTGRQSKMQGVRCVWGR